jgi:hypothetical protein
LRKGKEIESLKNCIDATTMKMAKSNRLKIKMRFFEKGFVVSYIYVLAVMPMGFGFLL